MKIKVGLYGNYGHQIQELLVDNPMAELVATAGMDKAGLPEKLRGCETIRSYGSLYEMLTDTGVELVSLCSPRRRDQAEEAILCLESGRHVYAEKPCAMTEEELDQIMETSRRTGRRFHEMAGTAFGQPYLSMRKIVAAGTIGPVVQVFAQKSYPYHDGRPQDEAVDGGLICQNGIHALRFVEHVALTRIKDIYAIETRMGNPRDGGLQMAASYMMTLENGGVASVIANYLNQGGFGQWGNEHLRIFGTQGFIESVDGGRRTRMVIGDQDMGPIELSGTDEDYFNLFLRSLLEGTAMPMGLEEELHPTRMVIRAKKSALSFKAGA